MAYRFKFEDNTPSVNLSPATIDAAIYNLLRALKAAGWTVLADSDGTTYAASGGQITGGGSGAHGLANNSAWFRLTDPASNREWTFQRVGTGGSTGSTWRVKVSPAEKFGGGSPGVSRTPSATDEQVLRGGGTDASPTGQALTTIDSGLYTQHIGCDASILGVGHFGFYSALIEDAGASMSGLIYQDPMMPGSYPPFFSVDVVGAPGNPDPVCYQVTDLELEDQRSSDNGPWAYLGSGWKRVAYATLQCAEGAAVGGGVGPNPFTAYDDLLPVAAFRHSGETSPHGWQGWSSLWRIVGVNRGIGAALPVVNATNVEVDRRVTLDHQFTLPFPVGVSVTV